MCLELPQLLNPAPPPADGQSSGGRPGTNAHLLDLQCRNHHALDNVGEEGGHVVVAHGHVGDNLLERDLLAGKVLVLLVTVELGAELCYFALRDRRHMGHALERALRLALGTGGALGGGVDTGTAGLDVPARRNEHHRRWPLLPGVSEGARGIGAGAGGGGVCRRGYQTASASASVVDAGTEVSQQRGDGAGVAYIISRVSGLLSRLPREPSPTSPPTSNISPLRHRGLPPHLSHPPHHHDDDALRSISPAGPSLAPDRHIIYGSPRPSTHPTAAVSRLGHRPEQSAHVSPKTVPLDPRPAWFLSWCW